MLSPALDIKMVAFPLIHEEIQYFVPEVPKLCRPKDAQKKYMREPL